MEKQTTRFNSRQRRRNANGYKGDGSHKWVKETPVGHIFKEKTAAEIQHMSAIKHMQRSASRGGFMTSKHQGSKPQRIIKTYMGYNPMGD